MVLALCSYKIPKSGNHCVSLTLCLLLGGFSSYWVSLSSLRRRVTLSYSILNCYVCLLCPGGCSFLKSNGTRVDLEERGRVQGEETVVGVCYIKESIFD